MLASAALAQLAGLAAREVNVVQREEHCAEREAGLLLKERVLGERERSMERAAESEKRGEVCSMRAFRELQRDSAKQPHALTSQAATRTHQPSSHTHSPYPPSFPSPSLPPTYPLQAFFNLKQSELTKREGILEERLEQLHRSEGKLREREESSERTNREVVTQETALRTQARQCKAKPLTLTLPHTAAIPAHPTTQRLEADARSEELQRRLEEVREAGGGEAEKAEQYDLQVCDSLPQLTSLPTSLPPLAAAWWHAALARCSLLAR